MKTNNSIRICLQCNKEINNNSIKICPYCQCIDLMDKENYFEIINNYKQASPSKKQFFYNDPVFIKIMCYHPDEFKRESPTIHNNIGRTIIDNSHNTPRCPTCNSTNVQKISVAKKATGFALVGIFSSNFGKTMQCKNCGYKF